MAEFININGHISPKPKGCDYDLIPSNVYKLNYDSWSGELFMTESSSLNMPHKLYQTNSDKLFKTRVLSFYHATKQNTTGVMLAGEKGTGKSVNAKQIAIESELPIIIIDGKIPERTLTTFFSKFEQEVCLLFDEVEKNFNTERLLEFLDGVEKTCKKLIIFTCNDLKRVSEYMQDRCSRVRYLRKFTAADNLEFLPQLIKDYGIENPEEVANYCKERIGLLSMDNILAFLNEIKMVSAETKEDPSIQYTLDDIIAFMNISKKGQFTISEQKENTEKTHVVPTDEGIDPEFEKEMDELLMEEMYDGPTAGY